jgi:hypothetical protein
VEEETNVLSIIIPTPGKKRSAKKHRKRQETRHTTSDSYLKQTLAKRKLKVEKERNAKFIPKKEKRRSLNVMSVFTYLHEDNENMPCGFCGLKYSSVKCVQKGDWIGCQKCKTWYHEVCVGAAGRKQLKCGKCL